MARSENGDPSMAIKQVADTETVEKKTTIEGNKVTVLRTVRPDGEKGTLRRVVNWTFNFENVTKAELLELATATTVINAARVWRGAKDRDADVWGRRNWSVREMIDSAGVRTPVDPMTAATRAIDKMSATERAELLKKLQSTS